MLSTQTNLLLLVLSLSKLWDFYSGEIPIESLRSIQRRAVRAILKEKWNSHTPPLFSKLKFLIVDDVVINYTL